ncbi:hypothetical protein DXG01_004238 [Tephrocybe rancida]|nr:hypothetical protein DXG01_004238 [Tephrocybe rancida]
MPSLDIHGKIAAAQIAFYTPVAAFTIILVWRYAFRRDAGWLFLFIFSAARLAEAALLLAGELAPKPKIDIFIAAYVLQAAGIAPLLLSTVGFLGMAYVNENISINYEDLPYQGMSFGLLNPAHKLIEQQLLGGATLALPLLGVRVAYAVLSAWSASDLFGNLLSSNPILAKFNPVRGQWIAFLVMSVVMEFVITALYLLFSTVFSRRHSR